jgi:hypothetical protein
MTILTRTIFAGLLWAFAITRAGAVYAPIPDVELGKLLTVYVSAGAYYDSNISGGPTEEFDSMVYQVAPSLAFNVSATDQTFLSASYRLSLDHFADRPGDKTLDSHALSARIAHTFSPLLQAELTETFQVTRNPESLLPGLSTILSTDQSYTLNQLDGRLAGNLTKRTGVVAKARGATFAYDDPGLSQELDRLELLLGIAATHTLLPELQAVLEYRHQAIRYDFAAEIKDKDSDFLLGGADYAINERAAVSGRLGAEYRRRKGDSDETLPYVELAGKLDYAKESYVSAGYGFAVEEVSNLDVYTDMSVHRFFVNVQHVLTPKLVATGSFNWEPSVLNGRRGVSPDRDETNTKVGLALVYRAGTRWVVSATIDWDNIASEDNGRDLQRLRAGANVRWVF